jgi:hypothetical protein
MSEEIDVNPFQAERQEINDALDVSCYSVFGIDDDIFLLDYWDPQQALNYLTGILDLDGYGEHEMLGEAEGTGGLPSVFESNNRVITLEGLIYSDREQPAIFRAFQKKLNRLTRVWESGRHENENPPIYYIEWALSKGFDISWLKYATEKGFYMPKKGTKFIAKAGVKQPADISLQSAKWRKAFEYESEGLNALYDIIESYYFDDKGKPIYDPSEWSLKKSIVSNWLTGRTLDEADTIITSGKRKGRAEK